MLQQRESVGRAIGSAWAPAVAMISSARHARMFHPEGVVCRGAVEAAADGRFAVLGARLGGPVLARFSAALWRGAPRWFDVLGVALRFGDDQDLLFATIRSPFTMPLAPLATRTDDFLANRYWAVSPFEVAGVGRLKFRLTPTTPQRPEASRPARLRRAVTDGVVGWDLEARPVFRPRYQLVARLRLDHLASDVDQAALRFDPCRAGRGIVPSGLVHATRPATYASSQRARPLRD